MKRLHCLMGIAMIGFMGGLGSIHASSYTWNVAYGTWTIASNWSPSRTTPATDDILIFDGSIISQCSVNNIIVQKIGQLKVIHSCTAVFTAVSPVVLTLNTTGLSFLIDSTSQLQVGGGYGITLNLPSNSVGTVYGSVVFEQTGSGVPVLTSGTTNGIVFVSGASFQNAPRTITNYSPFASTTSTTANSIVFQSGATYYQAGTPAGYSNGTAGDPFTLAAPASVVFFQPGSMMYVYDPTYLTFSGRTVSNVAFDFRASNMVLGDSGSSIYVITDTCRFKSTGIFQGSFGGSCPVKIGGDLVIETGSGGLKDNPGSLTTSTNFEVQGNFNQNAGVFIPSSNLKRVYVLDGSNIQTLTLSASSTVLSNLYINNASGIVLGSKVSIISTLSMMTGNINTGSNSLTLGVSTTQTGMLIRTTGTIIGNFVRWISPSTGSYTFPIGTVSNFNEVTVNFTSPPTNGGTLTTFFTSSNPGTNGLPLTDGALNLDTVNPMGFWTVSAGNGLSGGTYNLTLEANGFTFIISTTSARIVKRTNGSSAWTASGSAGTNNGIAIVRTGLSNFSDFGIAEGSVVPVELSNLEVEKSQ